MLDSTTLLRVVATSFALAACTPEAALDGENGKADDDDDDVVTTRPDASVQQPDAHVPPPPDAAVLVDAGCMQSVSQLLANPSFDMTPAGTGWTQTLIEPDAPIITAEDGVPERSAPYKAWLGGIAAPIAGSTVKDVLVQEFVVPANTTQLTITGVYDVRTAEAAGTTEYDKATVSLLKPDGTVIVTMLSLSNLTPKTAWTPFGHLFSQNLAGQTVRLRITSINDELDVTSFFFDSLTINAITGCPVVP